MPLESTRPRPDFIPAAAWARPIGLPVERVGHPRTEYHIVDDGPYQGAPLGGLGAGTFGRTFRGDFARWHLDIGVHRYETLPANMFSVYMRRGDETIAQALWTGAPNGVLQSWNWNYPIGGGTYYALYPRSWFVYDWERFPVELSVEQFSPVIPGDYRVSSYPIALFIWEAHNPTDETITVGIMLTWQNLLGHGWDRDFIGGQAHHAERDGDTVGVVMTRSDDFTGEEWDGSWAIAAIGSPGVRLSYRSRFRVNGDGAEIWGDFAADGALENIDDRTPSRMGEVLGAGIAATFEIGPGETIRVPFAVAWDMPVMTFGNGTGWYKRYTAFFGRDGHHAWEIAREGLSEWENWRRRIIEWQQPILNDPGRPDWYKTALFNELYFLADGATAWEHGRVGEPEPPDDYIGGFLYIECFDYPFYATFDVDFYASFALLQLWPELEVRLMRDFAATVPMEDLTERQIIATGETAPRLLAGAVPHDLGAPHEDPWLMPNAYDYQDVNRWKDLNAKFVLRLYRDVVLLGRDDLASELWADALMAMDYLAEMDRDGDGIPENEGFPDQTYDTWSVSGVSAYSGGLWLAALRAARELALLAGDPESAERFGAMLDTALQTYEDALWNGSYYNYDNSDSPYHDSIMADQLAGQWYMDVVGLPLLPDDHIRSALERIYEMNVMRYGNGRLGAVNGMRPDGEVDDSSQQSVEVWSGTTYALSSLMMYRGMAEQAWATAHGAYLVTYETGAFWFRTPEAWDADLNFRATIYLRPLSIWALETAYRSTHGR